MDNIALLKRVHDPYERGESEDFQPVWDLLADDVRYDSPVGTVHGRQGVIDYFTHAAETIEFLPFVAPVQYFDNGERVIMLGEEHITDHKTDATTRGQWIWVLDMEDGVITRIVHFLHFPEDLSLLVDALKVAHAKTTGAAAA